MYVTTQHIHVHTRSAPRTLVTTALHIGALSAVYCSTNFRPRYPQRTFTTRMSMHTNTGAYKHRRVTYLHIVAATTD